MKQIILLFTTVLLISTTVSAQNKNEKAVTEAAEKLRLAMISGEKGALEDIAHDQLSYGHSGGAIDNKNVFVEKLVSGPSDFVEITITEQTVEVLNKTGIVRHMLFAQTNDNNKPGTVKLKVLLIFVKEGSKWKLVARQAVKLT